MIRKKTKKKQWWKHRNYESIIVKRKREKKAFAKCDGKTMSSYRGWYFVNEFPAKLIFFFLSSLSFRKTKVYFTSYKQFEISQANPNKLASHWIEWQVHIRIMILYLSILFQDSFSLKMSLRLGFVHSLSCTGKN